jgi:hypothetical protein
VSPSTPILILRFPDGDVEHRSTRGELPVGTELRSRGALWRISRYVGDAAMLESAERSDPAGGAPSVIPSPLGDDPITLEVLAEI